MKAKQRSHDLSLFTSICCKICWDALSQEGKMNTSLPKNDWHASMEYFYHNNRDIFR